MPFASIFIFDSSYPSIDIALPIEDSIPHTVVSNRNIEPPPGHRALKLTDETGPRSVLANLRSLRATRANTPCLKSIVIAAAGTRRAQLVFNTLYALSLNRNVTFFDGANLRSLRFFWRSLLKAFIVTSASALLGDLKLKLDAARFDRNAKSLPGSSTPEGSLFGLYTSRESFSLLLDQVEPQEDKPSIYGLHSRGWYLPAFSHRRQRYNVHTTLHSLRDVSLHVETRPYGDVPALFQNGKILDYPYLLGRSRSRDSYAVSTRRNSTAIERGVCLLAYTTGYYHWLLEGVPRILDLLESGLDLNRYPLILPPLAPFQRELLELLHIDPHTQVITLASGDWCHVGDCIFPTAPFPFGAPELEDPSGQPSRDLLLRIRDRLSERLPSVPPNANTPRKLYISRARAAKRKLTPANELAVSSLLQDAGYTTVYLEDLPWIAQVHLLTNAESVAGFHGAGIANILFSRANSLIEFHNPAEVRPYFAVMARELDIDYSYLIGSYEKPSPHFDNITLPLEALKAILERV
jgi:capsular polysaccharide biosynthesis protein